MSFFYCDLFPSDTQTPLDAKCSILDDVVNGTISCTNENNVDSSCKVTCNLDYKLVSGKAEFICIRDSTSSTPVWDNNEEHICQGNISILRGIYTLFLA